jgi:hypothetical protein
MKNHKKIESVAEAIKVVDKYVGRKENLQILEALGIIALNHHSRKECSCCSQDCEDPAEAARAPTPQKMLEILAQLNAILPEFYENQDLSLVECFQEIINDLKRTKVLILDAWKELPEVYQDRKSNLQQVFNRLVADYTDSAEEAKVLRQVNKNLELQIKKLQKKVGEKK